MKGFTDLQSHHDDALLLFYLFFFWWWQWSKKGALGMTELYFCKWFYFCARRPLGPIEKTVKGEETKWDSNSCQPKYMDFKHYTDTVSYASLYHYGH